MEKPVLWLRSLRVAYGTRTVLAAVNLEVFRGEPTVLLGPVAAGKSTLLRTLAGLNFQGAARISGFASLADNRLSADNHAALVAQRASVLVGTVAECIAPAGATPNSPPLDRALAFARDIGAGHLRDVVAAPVVSLPLLDIRLSLLVRFACEPCPMLALDEPTVGLDADAVAAYCAVVRKVATHRALLVATHNQAAARLLGGRVALLAAGRIIETQPTNAFFSAPRTATARHFVRTGSCPSPSPDLAVEEADPTLVADFPELFIGAPPPDASGTTSRGTPPFIVRAVDPLAKTTESPLAVDEALRADAESAELFEKPPAPSSARPTEPVLTDSDRPTPLEPYVAYAAPRHTLSPHWVFSRTPAGRLGGCRRPGLLGDLGTDLATLRDAGVALLVSLESEHRLDSREILSHGIRHREFLFKDMTAPLATELLDLCAEIDAEISAGSSVCVHCKAGLGRTGTVLAAYLIWLGYSVAEALSCIRKYESKFVSSDAQSAFLAAFSQTINHHPTIPPGK